MYQCTQCQYVAKSKGGLTTHMKSHALVELENMKLYVELNKCGNFINVMSSNETIKNLAYKVVELENKLKQSYNEKDVEHWKTNYVARVSYKKYEDIYLLSKSDLGDPDNDFINIERYAIPMKVAIVESGKCYQFVGDWKPIIEDTKEKDGVCILYKVTTFSALVHCAKVHDKLIRERWAVETFGPFDVQTPFKPQHPNINLLLSLVHLFAGCTHL